MVPPSRRRSQAAPLGGRAGPVVRKNASWIPLGAPPSGLPPPRPSSAAVRPAGGRSPPCVRPRRARAAAGGKAPCRSAARCRSGASRARHSCHRRVASGTPRRRACERSAAFGRAPRRSAQRAQYRCRDPGSDGWGQASGDATRSDSRSGEIATSVDGVDDEARAGRLRRIDVDAQRGEEPRGQYVHDQRVHRLEGLPIG